QWVQTQILTTNGVLDHFSALKIYREDQWLFISGIGTPLGETILKNKDFTGSLLIYRLADDSSTWIFHQSIDRKTPGLENLTVIDPASLAVFPDFPAPAFTASLGAIFGISFAVDLDAERLLVGASTQTNGNLINSGGVYAFQLINDK